MSNSILDRWNITPEELTELVDKNPSLRGMLLGYLAEIKLETIWFSGDEVSNVIKYDDHDRKKKGDRVVCFKGKTFIFESKSLQTASIQSTGEGCWEGKAQVDASDRREVILPDGSKLTTTCLLRGEFDILAINVFAFEEKWRFVFAKNSDLPTSRYHRYTDYQREHLLATLVKVQWPPVAPFREEPFTLMQELL